MDQVFVSKLVTSWRRYRFGWSVRVTHEELGSIGEFWISAGCGEDLFEVAYDRAIALAMQAREWHEESGS